MLKRRQHIKRYILCLFKLFCGWQRIRCDVSHLKVLRQTSGRKEVSIHSLIKSIINSQAASSLHYQNNHNFPLAAFWFGKNDICTFMIKLFRCTFQISLPQKLHNFYDYEKFDLFFFGKKNFQLFLVYFPPGIASHLKVEMT